ncbi:hypothetical protein ACSFA2_03755 [Variovorax sp. LT2P21]
MRSADFSADERSNVGGRSTVRTDQVDAELDNVSTSIVALCTNLALIQRDDGKLRDALVELYNLSTTARVALMAKLNPRGLWATAQSYAVSDLVDVGGVSYVCAIAHTSTVFATDYAAGRWQIFITAATAAGLPFTPTTTITANTAQAAIEEVDANLRAAAMPTHAFNFGGL